MDDKLDVLGESYEDDNIDNMYLTFRVADEDYAVGIAYVTEIVGIQKFKRVPDVPEFIKGVINLRGKVIPIMDVRLRFGLPEKEYNDRTCIIVLEVDGVPTGIVVDEVSEVLEIPSSEISPPPGWQNTGDKGVILGMGKLSNIVCAILDVSKFLFATDIVLPDKEQII
jgi:purine-binding chemotaxis protein CheW